MSEINKFRARLQNKTDAKIITIDVNDAVKLMAEIDELTKTNSQPQYQPKDTPTSVTYRYIDGGKI